MGGEFATALIGVPLCRRAETWLFDNMVNVNLSAVLGFSVYILPQPLYIWQCI